MWRRVAKATSDYLAAVRNPVPPSEAHLFSFQTAEDLARWQLFTDQQYGGRTTASLQPSEADPGTAVFSGRISADVDKGISSPIKLQRSGFCGMKAEQPKGQAFDLEPFDTLVIRAKGDGRKYLATLRTDDWITGEQSQDRWQAFLFARKGVWQDVAIPLHRFLLTWKGRLVETQSEMNTRSILSLSISLARGDESQATGDFRLGLDYIKAQRADALVDIR